MARETDEVLRDTGIAWNVEAGCFEFPDQEIKDESSNVTYTPFIDAHDGRVGYRCVQMDADKATTFIYFNPSDSTDDGVANVFVYEGGRNDPAYDGASHHYVIDFTPEED